MTVLLIPGLLCDRFVWEPLLARIDAQVADLSSQDSMGQMARDCLARFPGELQVVGFSMGARVAIELVRQAPERVSRLVLMDTGIHPLREGEREKRAEIVDFANKNGMAALAERWLPGMVAEGGRADKKLMQGLTDMVLRMSPELHARQIKSLVDRPDAASALAQITCPVLLMVGELDQWSPIAQHEDMLRLLPQARLEVIEGAGHFALVERPDEVADLITEFLKG